MAWGAVACKLCPTLIKGQPVHIITSSRWARACKTKPHTSLMTRESQCSKHTFNHACVCEKEANQKRACSLWTHTHTHKEVHKLYLFDIVACLCTCFNKQNIHLFCSLFSLLCGYLSVMSNKSTRTTHKHPRGHAHTARQKRKKEQGGKKHRLWLFGSGLKSRAPSGCCCHPCLRPKVPQ